MTFILTAAEMRAAEERAIAAGASVETLMERAGAGAAEAIWRYAGPVPTLVLCGPGNNGGDGYVVARLLAARGLDVRVAALGEPSSDAAKRAKALWTGPAEAIEEAAPAPLLVDALFGTGLSRGLEPALAERLSALAAAARMRVAIDLPSGAATDDGRLLSPVPDFDLTVTFGAPKPSHYLQPAARHLGRLVVADIGVEAESALRLIGRPSLPAPGPDDHKYTRGYVAVVAGEMPGAAALAASAAARAGAGYVRMIASDPLPGIPHAIVQSTGGMDDERIDAMLIGPGLGRTTGSSELLNAAFHSGRPLILDGDALALVGDRSLPDGTIMTPHEGEFARLFPSHAGSKLERARAAARSSGAIVVLKGADTVVAAPDGSAAIAPPAPHWLATAGTGDVLAGIVAALRARRLDPFAACCGAVWVHARAGERLSPGFVADDLLDRISIEDDA